MTNTHLPLVLVVDDELSVLRSCEKILVREGYEVRTAISGKQALALLEQDRFDILFTDLKMVELGGIELLEALRIRFPEIVTVVITGYASVASVVETMKLGAFDYLPKPFTPDEMAAVAKRAWEKRRQILEQRAAVEGKLLPAFHAMVGHSPKMQEIYRMISKVAPTTSTVLIVGETGTGKEMVARAIHAESARSDRKFFAIDCGTLAVNLLESELFGHVRGAFTGAVANKPGIFELTHRGTVFLDEICNVDLEIQGKLLRFIQEREFLPVGGTEVRHVDVRLIFATNRALEEMVEAGKFREDLYYRLYVYPIQLPSLRERIEDVPILAWHLLAKVQERSGTRISKISDSAMNLLMHYNWPGNVRQLESVIERAAITCEGDVIEPHHLPRAVTRAGAEEAFPIPHTNQELIALKKRLRNEAVADLEREFVLEALQLNRWNISQAALAVGIQRQNFQTMMRRHNIHPAHLAKPR